MKRIIGLLVLLIVMFVPFAINADSSYVCETSSFSCVFTTAPGLSVECTEKSTNKKIKDKDIESAVDVMKTMGYTLTKWSKGGQEVEGSNTRSSFFTGTCPDHLYSTRKWTNNVDTLLLVNNGQYTFSDASGNTITLGYGGIVQKIAEDDNKTAAYQGTFTFVGGDVPTTTQAGGGNNTPEVKKDSSCPLGPQVTKDLSGALRVMKIMAPVFVLVYTIYDAIVTITKGDIQAEGKKMLQKFLKRLAAAITLFAIPVLIDVLMQMFNIWGSDGHCSFVDTSAKVQVVQIYDR